MSRTSITDSTDRRSSEEVDRFYRALANHRRRIAIRVLETNRVMELDALADAIASREPDGRDEEEVRITLVHQHLPLLSDAGIVEYDRDAGRVTIEQTAEAFLPFEGPVAQ